MKGPNRRQVRHPDDRTLPVSAMPVGRSQAHDTIERMKADSTIAGTGTFLARQIKLKSRRKRSGYAAWMFLASAAIYIVTMRLVKEDPPDWVLAVAGAPLGLSFVWIMVESALLASSVSVTKNAAFSIPIGGLFTCGIVPLIAILFLRRKEIKELAAAKTTDQLLEIVAQPGSMDSRALQAAEAELGKRAERGGLHTCRNCGRRVALVTEGLCPLCSDAQTARIRFPVRTTAVAGMIYGILAGVCLQLAFVGLAVYQRAPASGAMLMALPVCWVGFFAAIRAKLPTLVQTLSGLVSLVIINTLSSRGFFPMLCGAAFSGGLLFCMPGMAIGAAIGVIRRPHPALGKHAPQENPWLRVGIPVVISIALWTAYLLWARGYLRTMIN